MMNKGLQHDDFNDMSTSKLVNYLCRANLEADKNLLEAQKVNMEKKQKNKKNKLNKTDNYQTVD